METLKKKLEQMEEEAAKLNEMKEDLDKQLGPDGGKDEEEEAAATDDKSVYVGQVDYDATPEELQAFFQTCGTIERVTIVCDTYTRRSKGYAYIEFAEAEAVQNAVLLNDSAFRGRQLKVLPKRINKKRRFAEPSSYYKVFVFF